jgi:DNA-binding transcriptional ArsR family regulator
MNPEADLAWIASVVGDPARARMLSALMDRRARTAKELAFLARVAPATASAHLSKLLECKLVSVDPQGRHRYFRLASAQVAQMIEAIGLVAGDAPASPASRSRLDETMATARTCYDHIAGRLGVAIADALQDRGHVVFADGAGEVTASGRAFLCELGIDVARISSGRRVLCRPCLDWTERRHHLAGAVGAAICEQCLGRGWLQRTRDTRALTISADGRAAFASAFGIDTDRLAQSIARATATAA